MNYLTNLGTKEDIPSHFSEFINDIRLGDGVYIDRYGLMPLSEYDILCHTSYVFI